jgi:Ni/Fe-hydrogenase subunit HybB-like protein
MRPMARRVITVTARIAFIVCGLTTLFTGFPYVLLRGESLPVESEWIIFVIALALLGGFSLVMGLLPRSWIAKLSQSERDDDRLFSVPLKLLGIFAAIFYVIAAVADFAPHTWNLNPQVMLALCPLYFIKQTIDPSPLAVFAIMAPMNAAVYGCLGAIIGYARLRFRG